MQKEKWTAYQEDDQIPDCSLFKVPGEEYIVMRLDASTQGAFTYDQKTKRIGKVKIAFRFALSRFVANSCVTNPNPFFHH